MRFDRVRTVAIALVTLGVFGGVLTLGDPADGQQVVKQERRHLRHILVRSEAKADSLMKQIEGGADFKKLARRWSLDPTTKVVGGDLGEHGPIWDPPFNQAAFAIKEINGIAKAKSQYGWHVIQLLGIKEVEVKRPAAPKPKPKPQARGVVNEDLAFEARSDRRSYEPGEDIAFTISITNSTSLPIQVFNPKLWPLGLVMRYQFGRMNLGVTPPWGEEGEPEGGLLQELAAGQSLSHTVRLQDYTGDLKTWPIVRSIWRGDIFFQRLEKYHPSLAEMEGFGEWEAPLALLLLGGEPPQRAARLRGRAALVRHGARPQPHLDRAQLQGGDPGADGVLDEPLAGGLLPQYALRAEPGGAVPHDGPAGDAPRDEEAIFKVPRSYRANPQEPRNVSLIIDGLGQERAIKGRLAFSLDDPKTLSSRTVTIGKVFKGQEYLDWASKRFDERMAARKSAPQLSIVNLYTYDILPPEVRELADLPMAERIRRDEAPRDANRPKTPTSQPKNRLARDLPRLELKTSAGTVVVELYEDHAPNTVANFIQLSESGFFDDTKFYRISKNDGNRGYIVGGSPDGTSEGGPGYRIKDEKHPELKHERGTLAMASTYQVADTGGSQFYICMEEQPQLDGEFTIFGHVIRGIEVVDRMEGGRHHPEGRDGAEASPRL